MGRAGPGGSVVRTSQLRPIRVRGKGLVPLQQMEQYARTLLTVREAARRVRRDPETIRRWIRSGKLRSHRVGTQHRIAEEDLAPFEPDNESLPVPVEWRSFPKRESATGLGGDRP